MPSFCLTFSLSLWLRRLCLCSTVALLVACGGGGETDRDLLLTATGKPVNAGAPPSAANWVKGMPPNTANWATGVPPTAASWVAGVFRPIDLQANLCVAPRNGIDPYSGEAYPDKPGRALDENHWLRTWTNDKYLWYNEVVDRDPALHATPDYFALLKTAALTASGAPKDQFHFLYRTAEWNALSLAGESPGYGIQWAMLQSSPPRELVVVYTEPDSPASAPGANIARGARVLMVNAIDLVNETNAERIKALSKALHPALAGVNTQFTILDAGATVPRIITLQSAQVTSSPVHNVKTFEGPNGHTVGYLQFNDHIRTAELQLSQAIEKLRQEGATELVVDLRYNGGGYLYLASQLAYMIAGEKSSRGKIFERSLFNDKIEASGKGTEPMPFLSTGSGNAIPTGTPLPSLALRRVYVLTGSDTCSASESLINGLQGIDIEVVKIGATTCGKPYGFYPEENCGTTYFSVQLRSENAKGFGDYADGMQPTCSVPDDYEHPLGDPREARMAAALAYMATGACPEPAAIAGPPLGKLPALTSATPLLRKSQGLRNRILLTR